MKLALLYSGPYRASDEIVDNHMTTFGSDIDIYVSCFEHYLDEWKSSKFNVTDYFITPTIEFSNTNWSNNRDDAAGQSGFWQFWNIRNVIQCVPKKYDYYIKNRNDLVFNTKFELDTLDLKDNTLYSTESSFHRKNWDINNSINDEFYIGSEYTMNVVSNFVTDYYNVNNRHYKNAGTASNESQLRNHLSENNVNIELIKNLSYSKNHNGNSLSSGYIGFQLEKI